MKKTKQILGPTVILLPFIFSTPAFSDEVINDDLIVTSDTCVGSDCVDGEEFGFLGIKIKNEEPQILFDDTSSTGTFPTNNWLVGITDNALSGTANFFIKDADADADVLLLEPGTGGGIALGSGSAVETGAVSVGAAGMERRIMHVAEGTEDTDAVNKAQLESQFASLSASIEEQADGMQTQIDEALAALSQSTTEELAVLSQSTAERIGRMETRIDDLLNRINNL